MNHQHQRTRWHDYREPGIYMITIVANRRGTPFGCLEEVEGEGRVIVKLSPLGQAVERQIHELPKYAEGLAVLRAVVMPDHIHVVLHVQKTLKRHLGALVHGFKYGTTVAYLHDLDARYGGEHRVQGARPSARQRIRAGIRAGLRAEEPPSTQPTAAGNFTQPTAAGTSSEPTVAGSAAGIAAGSSIEPTAAGSAVGIAAGALEMAAPVPVAVGAVGSGSSASIPSTSISPSTPIPVPPLWAAGYHDRILYGRDQLSRMLHYVSDNPRRGWIKRQHRDLFYNKRMIDIPISIEQARWLLREARSLGVLRELPGVLFVEEHCAGDSWRDFPWWQPDIHAAQGVELRAHLRMKMMGNGFLLDEALLVPVRISRRIPPGELQRQKGELLERCEREGAVIITPAVSPGEEEVMGAALEAGYNVIRLQASAMSDVWAPPEPLLPPTSQGQLLFLAPWPERPQSEHPHKGIFELLNTLSKLLAER